MVSNQAKFKETEIGPIPEEWNVCKISDVTFLITKGTTPTTIGGNFSDKGIRFIKVENLSDDGKILDDKLTYIDEDTNLLLKRSILQENDLLYSIAGTIGRVAIVTKEFLPGNTNQALAIVRPNLDKINLNYLKYFLISPFVKYKLASKVVQGVQANLSLGELGDSLLFYPDLVEQKEIAEALSSLDDKIELNRKINANLEKMASALFKQWFVVDGHLFKESKISKLGEVINIVYGKGLPTDKLSDTGYPVFGGNGVIGFHDKYLYDEPQIIIGCRGAGSGNIKQTYPKSFVTNNSLVLEISNGSTLNRFYLKHFLQTVDIKEFVTGSAQPQITIENLRHLKILVPPVDVLKKFESVVSEFDQLSLDNKLESLNLERVRDSLLPRLMSGRIRVK